MSEIMHKECGGELKRYGTTKGDALIYWCKKCEHLVIDNVEYEEVEA